MLQISKISSGTSPVVNNFIETLVRGDTASLDRSASASTDV